MNEIGFPGLKLHINIFSPSLITININKSENAVMINSETMKLHCIKSVRIRSYCSPYSVRIRKNTDQNNSGYGHFLRRTKLRHFKNFSFIPGVKELHLHGRQIILLNFDSLFKVIKFISSFLEQIILNLMIS